MSKFIGFTDDEIVDAIKSIKEGANIGGGTSSADLDKINARIDKIDQTFTSLDETIGKINDSINGLAVSINDIDGNIGQLQINMTGMQEACQIMQNDITDLTDNVIPAMKKDIANAGSGGGGGSGSEQNWVTLYDETSTDAALNWGYPKGIGGNKSFNPAPVDFRDYKSIRISFRIDDDKDIVYFDTSDLREFPERFLRIFSHTGRFGYMVFATAILFSLGTNGDPILTTMPLYFFKFFNAKTPTVTTDTSGYYVFSKIEGLPF